ncbi:DUF255 domain-containing protein [archaeon AH-315-M20]|nr:DUF255 domain-containing protein [archaeon AH-315-M20]
MKKSGVFLLILVFLLYSSTVIATSHYTYEHAEEMKTSGRIDWRDYGPEAFQEAVEENKPIFLMLTAPSWCYWCHVYTSDDYIYHPEIYPTINEKFIPIYVDADKRQDLTRQYLEGGWPSTTVMAPNRERLFGYSGPRPIPWMQANFQQAVNFVNSRGFSNQIQFNYQKTTPKIPSNNDLNNLINGYASIILQASDPIHGGFGTGQKFPQGRSLDFSLELYELTGNKQFLDLVQNTIKNQYTNIDELETNYNLFDPIEGGFHRYGTNRDWTPPHYEKMLYDNARLLKAYSHLLQTKPDDKITKEVVEKTLSFIENNWYDKVNGGFYGNSDVHGEDEYYGKNPRPLDKPRVEKTKYSDWNSDAIVTYLYLFQTTNNEKYKLMVEKTLDFFSDEMVTGQGALHFKKIDGEKGVRGSLLDNAYLLLAFVEGYDTLKDEKYLEAAKQLADYSLENLYDWNSGGFFERNSPDTKLYAPGENIILSKPMQENGIIAFALIKLYTFTKNPIYLNAAIKTVGNHLSNINGLDRSYYYIKAAQFLTENNLLLEYEKNKNQIRQIEKENQEDFWLNELIKTQPAQFQVSEQGLEKLKGSILLLIIIALIAGFVSFASPCTLPILPAYIAYAFRSSKQNIKGMTIAFFLGLSIVFTLLGMSASFIGSFLRDNLTLFSQIAGVAIILFGIYILLGKGFTGLKIKQKKPTTYIGSFFFGTAFGISWAPCVGPILVAILLLASTTSSIFTGGLLLFVYAVGLALPLILISLYLEKINKESRLWKIIEGKELHLKIGNKKISLHTNSLISGLLFIILGYLIFSGILFAFNQYITTTSFQKFIFGIEDWLLGLVR